MEKLWRWEEKSYQQEKKRKILWTAAVISWILSLLILYYVGETVYGGVIQTGASSYAAVSIGVAIGTSLRYGMGKEPKPMTEKRWRNSWIFAVIGSIVIETFAIFMGMYVQAVQYFCLLILSAFLVREEKKDIDKISLDACTLLSIAVVLSFSTYVAPKLMGMHTTGQAERIVTAEGYEEAEYLGWMKGAWVYRDAVDKSFYEEEMQEEKYYMVFGRKDGEPYRFVIDPKGGEILIAASETAEPKLGNWYRSREGGV